MKEKFVYPLVIDEPEIFENGSVMPALLSVSRGMITPFVDMLIEINYFSN